VPSSLERIRKLWESDATRDVSELWAAILGMTNDPISVADRIEEAGQRDASVEVDRDTMDEIHAVAIEGDESDE
jgi:2-phospho-L-lactate transferase/gluconeogenesis factor (CofD/UPF0052 family)